MLSTKCSREENVIATEYSFAKHLAEFVNLPSDKKLSERLNHNPEYNNIQDILSGEIKEINKNSNNTYKPTEFDMYFISIILKDLLKKDTEMFFNKMDYYQKYVNKLSNEEHKIYLSQNLEKFKWVMYSISKKGSPDLHRNFDSCFDKCMEKEINDMLSNKNLVKWTYFLLTAAETTALWVAGCIYDCV